MRHAADRLEKQEAFARAGQVDPSARQFAGEAVVVAGGIEAEQREVEAVLAPGGAVAAAHVAARPRKHGHHVEAEGERRGRASRHDPQRNLDRVAGVRDANPAVAVGDGFHHGTVGRTLDHRQRGVGEGDLSGRGDVERAAIGGADLDDDPLPVERGVEPDLGWEDLDGDGLESGGSGGGSCEPGKQGEAQEETADTAWRGMGAAHGFASGAGC